MLDFLELEETVGKAWHRLVGGAASYPHHPEAAVTLDDMRTRLGIVFRGLGGEHGVQLAGVSPRASRHRLSIRQYIGQSDERLSQPGRDGGTLFLPQGADLFPARALNEKLYLWLAAYFAEVPLDPITEADPLKADLLKLRRANATVKRVIETFPGLRSDYAELCQALAGLRPARKLPRMEMKVEQLVRFMLGAEEEAPELWAAVEGRAPLPQAPVGYQPFLPVPLWGDAWARADSPETAKDDEPAPGSSLAASDTRKRSATRRKEDGQQQRDPFILNRFEKILAMAEMVNVNRPSDDNEDENAEKAADEFDDLPLSNQKGKPASRLKFDLDLAPEAVDRTELTAELTYPEWDYTRKSYLPRHCRVLARPAEEAGESWEADEEARRRIRRVKRQFEALRPKNEILRAQPDGEELDIDALVRARSDFTAGGTPSDRVYLASRRQARDLAVATLVDVSLSTDSWMDDRRVLDIEKEALMVLAHGINACGDDHAVMTFTSRRRNWVRVETVKGYDEPLNERVIRRIGALKPGYYTRIGAAIRHVTSTLVERPNRQKLMLVLTDGKPNDVDHYEGRFGIEDTRRAVMEARRAGLAVFGVTVDREAQSYFPTIFGTGGYSIVSRIANLPSALPAIYRSLLR
jgi:nitric oxide reductase NorD protein